MCSNFGIKVESFNPNIWFAFTYKTKQSEKSNFHSHDCTELIYILSGEVSYAFDDKIEVLKKGDLLIISPKVLHKRITDTVSAAEVLCIGIHGININKDKPNRLIYNLDYKIITLQKNSIDFANCCSDLMKTQEKDEPGAGLIIKSIIMKMIVLILKILNKNEENSTPKISYKALERSDAIKVISSYMTNNYMNNISLDKIARNIYLSPIYISKLFKEELGESPINHLIKIRLSKAAELLENTDMSIKDISKTVGYKDSFYFSKLFKKYYNLTATEYKNQLQNN